MVVVVIDDPCTVGRSRFPAERRFESLRDAERYVRRAKRFRLRPTIELRGRAGGES
jgi:hypothetical protein